MGNTSAASFTAAVISSGVMLGRDWGSGDADGGEISQVCPGFGCKATALVSEFDLVDGLLFADGGMLCVVSDVGVNFKGDVGGEGGTVRTVAGIDQGALDEAGEVVLFGPGAGGGVERNAEKDWDECLTDGDNVLVFGLARAKRGERFLCLFKGGGYFFGSRAWKRLREQ